MAQSGISINLLSNVREAVRGSGDVADAVEEVGDRLHDLTREGATATDRLEDDFRDLTRAADRSADELRSKFRDAYKSVRTSSSGAADDVVRDSRRIADRSQEVGDEIRQNLGEGLANAARGDFSQLSDTIGDTLGGITAGIGGIGTALGGIVAAVGLGALVGTFQAINEETEKSKERVKEWRDAFIEAGSDVLNFELVQDQIRGIADDEERMADAQRIAAATGLDLSTVLAGLAGDMDSYAKTNAAVNAIQSDTAGITTTATGAIADQSREVRDATQAWQDNTGEIVAGRAAAAAITDALAIAGGSADAAAGKVDGLAGKINLLPKGVSVPIDVDLSAAEIRLASFVNRQRRIGVDVQVTRNGTLVY